MNMMRNSGVVRKTDTLGRVCIPKDFRTRVGITEIKDNKVQPTEVEIFCTEGGIFIRPYNHGMLTCKWCGDVYHPRDLVVVDEQYVCECCYGKIKQA